MADETTQKSSLESMVLALLDAQSVKETQVAETVTTFRDSFFPELSEEICVKITKKLLERLAVELELGVAVTTSDFVSWLPARKPQVEWKRWGAYRRLLLQQGRPLKVLDRLGEATDQILDLAGDPRAAGVWQRKGLVIGEVQSGKTSSYIGLINKAADAGYKLFVLIGGHTESLRRQTQARVDEGFVGRDSAFMSKELRHLVDQKLVGVGTIDPGIRAYGFTTISSDFSIRTAQSFNFEVSEDMSEPIVLVVKKNTKILQNLKLWLDEQAPAGGHKMPLLLLDDEADYASINTKGAEDPTAVNSAIRDLLNVSQRSSYVGFTATPFANVLINDADDSDLFPRDFIYTLESPTNYVGADAIFSETDSPNALRALEDAGAVFPFKHKSGLEVEVLPASLTQAVAVFIVANAIRDLRGDENEPRSMLINVSRFNNVQSQVHDLVEELLATFRNAIEFDSHVDGESPALSQLRAAFETEFRDSEFEWEQIDDALTGAVDSMEAVLVNSKSKSADTYSKLSAAGRTRIIATGGAVLSRGLTLNGLMISYFYQRSRASDTLMQMGRWFGYRDGYRDLCRLWIDDEVAGWYEFVADSARELRGDLREMNRLGLTPEDFGLKVRKHPESLLVTAANKSKSAQTVERTISVRDKTLETAKIFDDGSQIKSNWKITRTLIEKASVVGGAAFNDRNAIVRGVPKELVADFVNDFGSSAADPYFAGPLTRGESAFANYIRSEASTDMQHWNLILVGGSQPKVKIGAGEVSKVRRKLTGKDGHIYVSGDRRRVAGPADLAPLVSKSDADNFKASRSVSTLTEKNYRELMDGPALLIYLVDPTVSYSDDPKRVIADVPLVAIKVSFPADPLGLEHEIRNTGGVKYLINSVLQKEWLPDMFLDLDEADVDDLDE